MPSRSTVPGRQRAASTAVEKPGRSARRYGFACSNCRRRKAKCDGNFPACLKCVNLHEECSYEKKPSVASIVSLQHQLKGYADRFEQLRSAQGDERDALLQTPIVFEEPRGGKARASSPSHIKPPTPKATSTESDPLAPSAEADPSTVEDETAIGADGHVYFYGKTSLYHINARADTQNESRDGNEALSPNNATRGVPAREDERAQMRSFLGELQQDMLAELLETYWCWPHHLHCVLCKKVFIRDLQNLGPCVSPFLLSAVLAQAARYSTRSDAVDIGDRFARRALQLLVVEIDRGSSIPAIQGLLIFSARECACGRTSQGWLYSGMAFRMARDLGVHVAPKKLGPLSAHFSQEELALRQQIFWSCYTWDKTMSLCLGRAPIMEDTIDLPTTESLLDGQDADRELWQPVVTPGSLSEGLTTQRALSSIRFIKYCELCIIIHDVLNKLYSRPHRSQRDHMLAYLIQTLERLDEWSSQLPSDLLVQENMGAVLCPPLHVLLLNLLHHTTVILLCRPYRIVSGIARIRCTKAARMIDGLFTLHVRRFGFRSITWLQSYTMFVACTINVWDRKENRPREGAPGDLNLAREATARLEFGLELLRQAGSTPSASRCASIIVQLLQTPGEAGADSSQGPDRPSELAASTDGIGKETPAPELGAAQTTAEQQAREVLQPSAVQLQTCRNGVALGNDQYLGGYMPPLQTDLDGRGIEAPFQWLPENLRDDASWMLMGIDFNSWPMFNIAQ